MTLELRSIQRPEEFDSMWSETCPDWVFFVVRNGKAKVLSICGRYFDFNADDATYQFDNEPADEADGLWIAEGEFVSEKDWETGTEEGAWEPSLIRPLTDEEWELYVLNDDPWPPEFLEPKRKEETCLPPFVTQQRATEDPDSHWFDG